MEAYISSSLGAYTLLQELEESVNAMSKHGIYANPLSASARRRSLRLTKTIDGQTTALTIVRNNRRTLVASLDDDEALDEALAKKHLAALLIPLVSEYVGSHDADDAVDRVRIAFGRPGDKRRRGKRCILFAEDAGIHSHPTLRPGNSQKLTHGPARAEQAIAE